MRRILQVILLMMLAGKAIAQLDAPALICDSVNADGSVTLIWEQVPDPTAIFTAYSVFYKPDPISAFSLVGQVTDIAQVTFRHAAAGADLRSRFYYVQAESTAGPSQTSDTIETIFLYFETDDNENISLYWNALHDPPLPTPNVRYLVNMEYPPGNWEELTNTQLLQFDYHFWFCNPGQAVVNFQVITQDFSTGCQSTSNVFGGVLSNLSQPDRPVMDSVSVDPSGGVIIGWQPASASDIEGYVIYRVTGINDSIAFVPGKDAGFYADSGADPCSGPVTYAIASVDSCGNKSPGTFPTPHRTIYLEDIQYDPCLLENTLTWTSYENFDPALAGYDIMISLDGGVTFQLLDTVPPQQVSYVHSGLSANTGYTYFVRAYTPGHGKTSTSCLRERRTFNSPIPEYLYVRWVTVAEDLSIDFAFYADTSAHLSAFEIYRGEGSPPVYTYLGEVPPASQDVYHVIDPSAHPSSGSVYYSFVAIDSCGNDHPSANIGRSIFLQAESTEGLLNILTWNEYAEWDSGIREYRIFRSDGEAEPFVEIGQTLPGELTYTDNISGLTSTSGLIRYFVEAYEDGPNQYGFADMARSNIVTADVIETVFVPNAFVPGGVNSTFKPVGSFIGEEGYLFVVYNRWGQEVFSTTNPSEAWDGRYKGKYVPQDVYVYLLRFTSATGDVVMRKGSVTVLF